MNREGIILMIAINAVLWFLIVQAALWMLS
jgi:hypothetical protein